MRTLAWLVKIVFEDFFIQDMVESWQLAGACIWKRWLRSQNLRYFAEQKRTFQNRLNTYLFSMEYSWNLAAVYHQNISQHKIFTRTSKNTYFTEENSILQNKQLSGEYVPGITVNSCMCSGSWNSRGFLFL